MKIEKKITAQEDGENLTRYFNEIRAFEPLTKEEERDLLIKIQKSNDQAALRKLISANLKFVVSVAKKYQNQGIPLLDLISEGNAGLIEATKRFDTSKDLKFFSYAVWWIRIKIFTTMDWNKRTIQLPANRELLVTRIKREILLLEQQLLRYPTIDELCDYLKKEFTEEEIKEAMIHGGRTASLQDKIGDGDDGEDTLEHTIEGERVDQIDKSKSVVTDLNRFLFHLTQFECDVLCLCNGLNGEKIMRNEDVAKALKLKAKDILKYKTKALKRLRKLKNVESLKDYLS